MRAALVVLLLAGSSHASRAAQAGSGAASSPLEKARQEIARLEALVEAGAAPRARLEESRSLLADAEDEELLGRMLYGQVSVDDLDEDQAEELLAAAARRLERQQAKVEHAKRLIEEGVSSRISLYPLLEELDRRRKTVDLAISRSRLLRELAEMARAEEMAIEDAPAAPLGPLPVAERYDGSGVFRLSQIKEILLAFELEFGRPLPVSAMGMTRVHKALGFDHRDRVDVALNPDQPAGVWLRRYLESANIPYFAFRSAIRGKSTAPHIHIGPPSTRLKTAD